MCYNVGTEGRGGRPAPRKTRRPGRGRSRTPRTCTARRGPAPGCETRSPPATAGHRTTTSGPPSPPPAGVGGSAPRPGGAGRPRDEPPAAQLAPLPNDTGPDLGENKLREAGIAVIGVGGHGHTRTTGVVQRSRKLRHPERCVGSKLPTRRIRFCDARGRVWVSHSVPTRMPSRCASGSNLARSDLFNPPPKKLCQQMNQKKCVRCSQELNNFNQQKNIVLVGWVPHPFFNLFLPLLPTSGLSRRANTSPFS